MSALTKLADGSPCFARIPLGFFGCSNCHDATDGRRFGLTKEAKRAAAHEAHCRTLHYLLTNGLIEVKVTK